MSLERRRHERSLAKKEAWVSLQLSPGELNPVCIGRLIDISQGGLAFDYIVMETDLTNQVQTFARVRLQSPSGPALFSEAMQCKIIRDTYMPPGSFYSLPIRRCGLQFEEPLSLSKIQEFV